MACSSLNMVTLGRSPISPRQFQEIASVGAGHVGDTADLPLAPQQAVVVELRDAVEVDGVDGTTPPLRRLESAATTTSPLGANVMARSSGTGGRSVRRRPSRRRDSASCGAMRRASRRRLRSSRTGARDREMRRGAETEEAHAIAGLDARDAQAAEADDPAHSRGAACEIVEAGGQRESRNRRAPPRIRHSRRRRCSR